MVHEVTPIQPVETGPAVAEPIGEQQLKGMNSGLLAERCWQVVILGSLFAAIFWEELSRLVDMWSEPSESHGLLIPAFSLYFLWQDRGRLGRVLGQARFWPNVLGLMLILLCLGGYLFSFFKGFAYPRQIMMLGVLGGMVLFVGGWPIVRIVWLPICFLLFAIPLPARLYHQITMPMREMGSVVAAVLLNALPSVACESVGVLISGVHWVVENGTRTGEAFRLDVAEACSGMRLLMAFVALGVAMAYLERRPWWQRITLVASTVPIAIFCNMLRVLLTGLIYVFIGAEYAQGTLHTLLGLVMLPVAFLFYGLLARLMNRLFIEEPSSQDDDILVVRRSAGRSAPTDSGTRNG